MLASFALVSALSALTVVLVMAGVYVAARRSGRVAVVDVAWGLGFVAIAVVAPVVGYVIPWLQVVGVVGMSPEAVTMEAHGSSLVGYYIEPPVRQVLLTLLVTVWAGRLAWHIARRARGQGEDPRYEALLNDGRGGGIVRRVLVPQGVAMWFVSMPLQVAAVTAGPFGWVGVAGVALWAVGLTFEAVGDAQLAAYKRRPRAERPPVMDQGLWRFTRHPNYFGDACVWWGIWLVAAEVWPGVLTVLSPVAMTFFLVFATGARLLEREMMTRPGYPEYAARTSMFLPLPPRRIS